MSRKEKKTQTQTIRDQHHESFKRRLENLCTFEKLSVGEALKKMKVREIDGNANKGDLLRRQAFIQFSNQMCRDFNLQPIVKAGRK